MVTLRPLRKVESDTTHGPTKEVICLFLLSPPTEAGQTYALRDIYWALLQDNYDNFRTEMQLASESSGFAHKDILEFLLGIHLRESLRPRHLSYDANWQTIESIASAAPGVCTTLVRIDRALAFLRVSRLLWREIEQQYRQGVQFAPVTPVLHDPLRYTNTAATLPSEMPRQSMRTTRMVEAGEIAANVAAAVGGVVKGPMEGATTAWNLYKADIERKHTALHILERVLAKFVPSDSSVRGLTSLRLHDISDGLAAAVKVLANEGTSRKLDHYWLSIEHA